MGLSYLCFSTIRNLEGRSLPSRLFVDPIEPQGSVCRRRFGFAALVAVRESCRRWLLYASADVRAINVRIARIPPEVKNVGKRWATRVDLCGQMPGSVGFRVHIPVTGFSTRDWQTLDDNGSCSD